MWKGGSEVNAQVSCGYTALHYAVWRRNEEMVQVLLDYHADYATADTRGMRALHYCVDSIGFRSGKCDIVQAERVLRLLLDKGAGLEVKDQGGRNVFQYAVRNGPESMMRLLLDSGANCKARDDVGRTPLHYSAFYTGGSRNQPQWLEIESVLLLLLDRGADLEAKDIKGKTVLRYALERKFDLMVRLLLENGADYRMTLSHSAALESYVGKFLLKRKEIEVAVLLLLDKEVDLEAKGKSGEIVLPYAVERGFEFLVKLLLREGAAYHVKAASQRTLMHRDAIRSSQSERPEVKDERDVVAKLLLDKPFDLEDEAEIIAFHSAAARGLEGLVGIFLDRRACPDFKGGHRVTAFRRTLLEGHEGVLGTLRVDPSRSRNERQMDNEASVRLISEGSRSSEAEVARSWIILHDAALQGHKRLALLMKYRGINLSAKFELGWTALIFASWAGSEEAVRLLLDGRVDVNAKDDDGYTALHYAAENNVEPVARLLCRGGAELNAKTLFTGNSALHLAVQGKDQVKRRLDWSQKTDVGGDQDVAKDEQSRGAADESRARADRKQELLLQLLLERGSDINSTNRRGQTPLHITAERGADRLVILLLDAGAKIDAATGDGETPLDLAMMNGHALTTKLLLERGAKAGNGNGTGWNTADWDDGEELDLVVVLQRLSAPRE
ncbi:MAG: hypothetical protein M1819_006926 [Sarea resinae]|nr:MAG: hypothetical protein M1819_006926 [Sarea resinae]